jgi:sporulation protein YlmC with PRC-barrel domain
MKKAFLKMTILGAACSMLASSAWAQTDSQEQKSSDSSASRSWSTKHLSATGRNMDHTVRASQLSGAQVNDSSGQRVGTIEDAMINPASGRVEFALISLNGGAEASTSSTAGNNSNTSTTQSSMNGSSPNQLVPVPWSLLKSPSSSSQYGSSSEKPAFTLNVDAAKLKSAPTVSTTDLSQSEWQQRIYSYYGVTPGSSSSMGASESPTGEIKGEGARRMENSTPDRQQPTVP